MTIDFNKLKNSQSNELPTNPLFAVIVAPSGSGKSYTMGTLEGDTLFLWGQGETHGYLAARARQNEMTESGEIKASSITEQAFSLDSEGNPFEDGLDAIHNLLDIIENPQLPELFSNVVIDGFSVIEELLRSSDKLKKRNLSKTGSPDTWAAGRDVLDTMIHITNRAQSLCTKGVNVVFTCGAKTDAVEEGRTVTPSLVGYQVAEKLIMKFDDILYIRKVDTPDGDRDNRVFDFLSEFNKTQKDSSGGVKQSVDFSPRISGLTASQTPPLMRANLSRLLKYKHKELKYTPKD